MIRVLIGMMMVMAVLLSGGSKARAHALDPGYLQIDPISGNNWRVFWRKPTVGGQPMAIDAQLPDSCTPRRDAGRPRFDGRAFVTQWIAVCPGGLQGGAITILGLEATRTDTLVRITLEDGQVLSQRLTADSPRFVIPDAVSTWGMFTSYVGLGFDHILEGFDHLLFVFALLVLIRTPGRLVGAVTAFTVAHSITLALSSLGYVTLPMPPVEAAIALSIVLLAVEILHAGKGRSHVTERFPWMVSFAFGLLHGLGFASALGEIGLPEGDVPLALLGFNVGVEAGQLSFVALVLGLYLVARMLAPRLAETVRTPGSSGTIVMGYAIGGAAVYWLAERVAGF